MNSSVVLLQEVFQVNNTSLAPERVPFAGIKSDIIGSLTTISSADVLLVLPTFKEVAEMFIQKLPTLPKSSGIDITKGTSLFSPGIKLKELLTENQSELTPVTFKVKTSGTF